MLRPILAVLLLAGPAFAAGDAALATAKAAHAKELAKLREQLLADIDKVIKQTDDMGGGIDYMIRERRGFAEVGVTPILPKLQPLSDKYLDAKEVADKALEEEYATAIDAALKAGKLADVAELKAELKKMRDARQGVTVPPLIKVTPAASGKDAQVESRVFQAKQSYLSAADAASATLIESIAQAKLKIASSTDLSDAAKLVRLDALTKDQEAFERTGTKPVAAVLQNAVRKHEEAVSKAGSDFTKAVNEAAKVYLDKKDAANYEALLKEKQRFLDRPAAVNLLALLGGLNEKLKGQYALKAGALTGVEFFEFPFELGSEYDLQLTVERLTGDYDIVFGLKAGSNRLYMILDAWPTFGYRSGILHVKSDGTPWIQNGTVAEKAERNVPLKTPVNVDLSVRKDSIRMWVKKKTDKDRRLIVDYAGQQDTLDTGSLKDKGKADVQIFTINSQIVISKFEYKPIGARAPRPAN